MTQKSDQSVDGRASLLPKKHEEEEEEIHEFFKAASFHGSVFNLSCSIIGAGIMSLPAVLRVLGLIPGVALIIFSAFMAESSVEILLRFSKPGSSFSYGEVMEDAFGMIGKMVVQTSVVVNNTIVVIVYLIIIEDVLSGSTSMGVHHSGILEGWFGEHWWTGRAFVLVLLTLLVFIPLICFKRIDSLRYTSAISLALSAVPLVVITGITIYKLIKGSIETPKLFPRVTDLASFWNLFTAVPIFVSAYLCHFNGTEEVPSSLFSFDRVKEILKLDLELRSCKVLLTSENFLQASLWRGREMVSTEDALKFMKARAARRGQGSAVSGAVSSTMIGPSGQKGKKRKEPEPSSEPTREAAWVDAPVLPELSAEHSVEEMAEVAVLRATEPVELMSFSLLIGASVCTDPDFVATILPQLLLPKDAEKFEEKGVAGVAERGARLAFEALSSFSWLKDKADSAARALTEFKRRAIEADRRASKAEQSQTSVERRANEAIISFKGAEARSMELQAELETVRAERAWLLEELGESKKIIQAKDAALQAITERDEYWEDKSRSIQMLTTVKVRSELMVEFAEGKSSSWNPEAAMKAWEEMKDLCSESVGEAEPEPEEPVSEHLVEPVEKDASLPAGSVPSEGV